MSRILSILISILIVASDGHTSSLATAENYKIGSIAQAIRMYQTINNRIPESWAQLKQVYELEETRKGLAGAASRPLEDYYEFIPQAMPFRDHGGVLSVGSQVLLLRTVPLESVSNSDRNSREQWRSMIVRSENGEITATSLPEADVQAMLKAAGVTLTPKPGLPTVESEDRSSAEQRPQPNPADAEFLRQHPELDPIRKQAVPYLQPTPFPTAPVGRIEKPSPTTEIKQSPSSSFPIVPVVIILAVTVCVIVFLIRRK